MYAYSQLEYEDQIMNDIIEKEMHNVKGQALRKLSSIVTHSNCEIANLLAHGYFDSLPDAEKIADDLGLMKSDFLAIREEFNAFKEEFLKDHAADQDFLED